MRQRRRSLAALAAVVALGLAAAFLALGGPSWLRRTLAPRTTAEVLADLRPTIEPRLRARFAAAGATYPPARATLVALKEERLVELWAEAPHAPTLVHTYRITAASGGPGPKLREGDRQVPEGRYPITGLNPNSRYHLSLQVGYPGPADRAHAATDGRTRLGGDIFIHGGAASIGCIALGDPAIEELFYLAATLGRSNVDLLIAPRDLRKHRPPVVPNPPWVKALHDDLTTALARYR